MMMSEANIEKILSTYDARIKYEIENYFSDVEIVDERWESDPEAKDEVSFFLDSNSMDWLKEITESVERERVYFTTAQAAHRLGMTPSGIRWMIKRGKLPAYKPSPQVTLIRLDDIEKVSKSKAARPKTK